MDAIQRLLKYVSPEPNSGCWLWIGSDDGGGGYGKFRLNGRMIYAHRAAYELLKGPVPHGLDLDHKCRTRCCVNPKHLDPVTHRENALRGLTGGHMRKRTHCPRGHEYTQENIIVVRTSARGYQNRGCRTCNRIGKHGRAELDAKLKRSTENRR